MIPPELSYNKLKKVKDMFINKNIFNMATSTKNRYMSAQQNIQKPAKKYVMSTKPQPHLQSSGPSDSSGTSGPSELSETVNVSRPNREQLYRKQNQESNEKLLEVSEPSKKLIKAYTRDQLVENFFNKLTRNINESLATLYNNNSLENITIQNVPNSRNYLDNIIENLRSRGFGVREEQEKNPETEELTGRVRLFIDII